MIYIRAKKFTEIQVYCESEKTLTEMGEEMLVHYDVCCPDGSLFYSTGLMLKAFVKCICGRNKQN